MTTTFQPAQTDADAINAVLSGKVGKMPDRWEKLLDLLGLELVIQPKQKG